MNTDPPYFDDLGTSCDTRYIGASLSKDEITIWKSDTLESIARVKPGFSGSSSRYQIDPLREVIYSGTWEDGLTCYHYKSRKVIWHRKNLIGIQTVNISAGLPDSLFLTLEAPDYRMSDPNAVSGIAEIDAQTGKTKWVSPIGNWLYLHPTKPIMVVQDGGSNGTVRILNQQKSELGKTNMVNFSIIDVGFSDDLIVLAEGEKGVRVIDFKGSVISSYVPKGRQPNCTEAAFDGNQLHVDDSWDGAFVSTIDPASGKLVSEYKRKRGGDICFIDQGTRFVDKLGQICNTLSGEVLVNLKP